MSRWWRVDFTAGSCAIVTGNTVSHYISVIGTTVCGCPRILIVAILAGIGRGHVGRMFAQGWRARAVVASEACPLRKTMVKSLLAPVNCAGVTGLAGVCRNSEVPR